MVQANIPLSSINFYAVAEYDVNHYFIQARASMLYMMSKVDNDYRLQGLKGVILSKEIKSDGGVFPAAGLSLGGYISQHISISASYDHVFATNSYNLNEIGDYTKTSYVKVPSMDLIGAQLSYHF